ncbi:MAG: type II toxin-antitoxin system RelE/ParE family toxin [Planctomycetales bacterium]|nr:type II toxin-antitoxin system RelE/ParE family toxin [Planctomycetales bacterium]
MPRFVLAPAAEQDIVSILAWTHEHFGEQARLRYEALLIQAIEDIAENPKRAGSTPRESLVAGGGSYHLWHSRGRVDKAVGSVHKPRHFLIFRTGAGGEVEIGRVLHDSMDLPSQLPKDYLADSDELQG